MYKSVRAGLLLSSSMLAVMVGTDMATAQTELPEVKVTAPKVLERHPTLKVAFLEANCSWLPWLLWRLDEAYELEGDLDMGELTMMPSAYFKRQCVASVEPDEIPARYTVDFLGNDNLVYSTDYPHGDSRYPHATESFLELPFSEEDKRKILWDNCARFYAVDDPGEAVSHPSATVAGQVR